MLDGKIKSNVLSGSRVKIVEKENQNTGQLTEGVVKQVLTTSAAHPYGIKVVLDNGAIGRVKEVIETRSVDRVDEEKSDMEFILPINEDQYTEFKATFRFDQNRFEHTSTRTTSKEVEKSISKTVAAFMNSKGGTLYIGVDDSGSVCGLEEDYKTLEKPNSDKLRLVIKNSLQGYLKDKIIFEHVTIDFPLVKGIEICKVKVSPSSIPIFVHDNGKEECYVRVDNESKPYDYKEFFEYWNRHINRSRI